MKGWARYLNFTNAMVAVETEGGFAVIEILSRCAIDISDRLTGPFDTTGSVTLRNESKDEEFDVFIERVGLSRKEAMELIG